MTNEVKHPEIHVQLVGTDGNAFSILGKCLEAMRRAKLSKEERDEFQRKRPAAIITTCWQPAQNGLTWTKGQRRGRQSPPR